MDQDATARLQRQDRAVRRGALAAVLSRAVGAITSVLGLAAAARSLDKESFGLVATLSSVFVIFSFADLGIGGVLMTRLARSRARGDIEEMARLVRDAFVALTLFGGVIAVVGAASAFVLPWRQWVGGGVLAQSTVAASVVILFICVGAYIPAMIASAVLSAAQRIAAAQVWTAVGSLASLAVCSAAAIADLPAWAYVGGIVGAPSLVMIGRAVWLFAAEYPALRPRRGRSASGGALEMVRASGYLAISRIAAGISFSSDVFVISLVMGPAAAAVFGVASRMFLLFSSILQIAGGQLWPALTDATTRGDMAWARSRYKRGLLLVGAVSAAGCLGLVIAGQYLARFSVGPALVPPVILLVVLGLLTLTFSLAGQALVLLLAVERIKEVAIVIVASAPINIVLSVFLTRHLGLVGPALGSLLAEGVMIAPVTFAMCHKTMRSLHATSVPE